MSMQMDTEFQKEQNGTLLSGWGHWVVGIGGGGGSRAPKPKNRVDVQYFFFWRLLRQGGHFEINLLVGSPPQHIWAQTECVGVLT
jgi:hypothetical protein